MISTADRICALLAASREPSVPYSDITKKIGGDGATRTALHLLTKAGKVTRTDDNEYYLTVAQRQRFNRRMDVLLDYFKQRLAA